METTIADVTDELSLIMKACSAHLEQEDFGAFSALVLDGPEEVSYCRGLDIPRHVGVNTAALDLEAAGIIILEDHTSNRPNKIRLAFSEGEIKMAFRDDHELRRLRINL